ncbi:MAG: Toxin-antitoxin system, toxin component, RelE family [Parcubacteria group bacterium GW2011_GWA1_47_8]|nr:MAG: Toxin-antitoxin system, toxin component, RelE family [Parcubacteria group bacterium GW2011_GWA1_47_8]
MKVAYTPRFLRFYKKLPAGLQDEVIEKIDLFKDVNNHQRLEVHKLKGRLKKFYGFSVDYKNRIVFEYMSKNEIVLLAVGDHEIYKMFL